MKQIKINPKHLAIIIGCAIPPMVAGVLCIVTWNRLNAARKSLAEQNAAMAAPASEGQLATLDERKTELTQQASRLSAKMTSLKVGGVIPDSDDQKKMTLELLDLAGKSGLHVQEVDNLGIDAKKWSAAIGGNPGDNDSGSTDSTSQIKFLTRFSPDGQKRPLVVLRCDGAYDSVRKFLNDLAGLAWKPTAVMFDIANQTSTTIDNDGEASAAKSDKSANIRQTLKMKIIISL